MKCNTFYEYQLVIFALTANEKEILNALSIRSSPAYDVFMSKFIRYSSLHIVF